MNLRSFFVASLMICLVLAVAATGGAAEPMPSVTLDLSSAERIEIEPDGYTLGSGVKIPYVGVYVITGSSQADTPLRFRNNDTDTPATFNVILDNATIEGSTYATAVVLSGRGDISVNLLNTGGSQIVAGNHPAFESQTGSGSVRGAHTVAITQAERSVLFLNGNNGSKPTVFEDLTVTIDGVTPANDKPFRGLGANQQIIPIDEDHFPDPAFRAILVDKKYDLDEDGKFDPFEIFAITSLNVENKDIEDLTGIAHFYRISDLFCGDNKLTSLDMSGNPKLRVLRCAHNELTFLNVTENPDLHELECADNALTVLNVTRNHKLFNFYCGDNALTALNVTQNPKLFDFNCANNALTALNVTQNPGLVLFSCNGNKLASLNLSEKKELAVLNCANNALTSLNLTQNPSLYEINCANNALTSLNLAKNAKVITLNCAENKLTSLDLTYFPHLVELSCGDNPLTGLDLSVNRFLTFLDCQKCGLTTLDLRKLHRLDTLICVRNQLTSLDLHNNRRLGKLACFGNKLTTLDVSSCALSRNISLLNQFKDAVYTADGADISYDGYTDDPTADHSNEAIWRFNKEFLCYDQEVAPKVDMTKVVIDKNNFPDEVFRQYVKDGPDTNGDGELSAIEIAAVIEIDLSALSGDKPKDLTGIEFFTELKTLNCAGCGLKELNVATLERLTYLDCAGNDFNVLFFYDDFPLGEMLGNDDYEKTSDAASKTVTYTQENDLYLRTDEDAIIVYNFDSYTEYLAVDVAFPVQGNSATDFEVKNIAGIGDDSIEYAEGSWYVWSDSDGKLVAFDGTFNEGETYYALVEIGWISHRALGDNGAFYANGEKRTRMKWENILEDRDCTGVAVENVNEGQKIKAFVAFDLTKVELTCAAATEGGSVTGSGAFYKNEEVTATATAEVGYVFRGWFDENDELVSDENVYTFKVTADTALTAKFEWIPRTPLDPSWFKLEQTSFIYDGRRHEPAVVLTEAGIAAGVTLDDIEVVYYGNGTTVGSRPTVGVFAKPDDPGDPGATPPLPPYINNFETPATPINLPYTIAPRSLENVRTDLPATVTIGDRIGWDWRLMDDIDDDTTVVLEWDIDFELVLEETTINGVAIANEYELFDMTSGAYAVTIKGKGNYDPNSKFTISSEVKKAPLPGRVVLSWSGDAVTAGTELKANYNHSWIDVGYRWYQDDTLIPGAETATYAIPAGTESGAKFTVEVYAKDSEPHYEGSITGSPVEVGKATLTGTLRIVDSEGDSIYEARVGDTLFYMLEPATAFEGVKFVWFRDDKEISGKDGATYTVTEDDYGAEISVRAVGQGDFTGEILSNNTVDVLPGSPVVTQSASAGNGSVTLQWAVERTNNAWITGFQVSLLDEDGNVLKQLDKDRAAREHTFTGLTNGETYYVAVLTKYEDENGDDAIAEVDYDALNAKMLQAADEAEADYIAANPSLDSDNDGEIDDESLRAIIRQAAIMTVMTETFGNIVPDLAEKNGPQVPRKQIIPLTIKGVTLKDRVFEPGKTDVEVTDVTFDGATLTLGSDYTAVAEMADDTAGDSKAVTVTVTLTNADYTLADNTFEATVGINKSAHADESVADAAMYGAERDVDLSGKIAAGGSAGPISVSDPEGILDGSPTLTNGVLSYRLRDNSANVGKTAVVTVPVTGATNYEDYAIIVTLTVNGVDTYTVTVKGGKATPTKAKAGETVTITADIPYGEIFGGWEVIKGNVVLDNVIAAKTTFTMPAEDVEITALWSSGHAEICPSKKFTDVDPSRTHWAHRGIDYVLAKGLMNGTGKTTFAPNNATTRAMIVTILYRLEGEPEVSGNLTFKDVPAGKWYSNAILWANQKNIVNGYNAAKFGPNDNITREQMATILFRYSDFKKYDTKGRADLSTFKDQNKISKYAVDAMKWAVAEGYINGTGNNNLSPGGNATRAQVATILMRFCEKNEV